VEVIRTSRHHTRERKVSPIQRRKAVAEEHELHKGKPQIESGFCAARVLLVKVNK